ncbi:recombinase family protein [Ruminiclostridium herbifermentans]|uniref:Recombinase family protein n=1 Tax=Ruminiclostridium herbifermentans TaxID=2488810 RepID=A0A4U7JI21_9FIRM|nr:recombinase family protein [Ruminiclostridium herbifermentans]QNU65780.1 recombinase family protein [Ruminiclostridium herbifermentans]
MEYTPPIVSGNRLEKYTDYRNTKGETGLNIGGYIRISTTKDSQKTSIENQKKYITEWAQINKYNIVDFYIDIKTGAYSYMRNEMIRLKNDVASKKVQGIVTKEISRTSRDIMDVIELKRSLADKGAFFISIKEGYDSRTDDDEFLLIIHAGLAQKERKVTSSRVKITQLLKAKEGKANVPCPALGYMLSEDKQRLVINPDTAYIYKLIVDKFLQGWGRLKICKYLNSNGITTKSGGKWCTNSIRAILTNPVYLGVTIYNATIRIRDSNGKAKRMVRPREDWIVKENTHPALITKEKFDRIQQIIQKRKENDSKEWSSTKKYLLSGLLYCACCGGKIYGIKLPKAYAKDINKQDRNENDYYYYYFDKKSDGKCGSKLSYYRMDVVEELVMDEIKKQIKSYDMLDDLVRNKQYIYNNKLEIERKECESLKDKIEAVNAAIIKQQTAFEADIITLDEYKCRMNQLREQKQNYTRKLEILINRLNIDDKLNSAEVKFNIIRDKVNELLDNFSILDYEIKEEIIRKIVKRIYINDDYSMKFEFNFIQ